MFQRVTAMETPYAGRVGQRPAGMPPTKPPDAQEYVRKSVDQAEQVVKQFPAACLAAAMVAGILLGWWIKRR